MAFQLHSRLAKDSIVIGAFDISLLLMINDAAYPWFVLVPQIDGIKDAHQMTETDHIQVLRESRALSVSLMAAYGGEKLNIAALGNMVPQLHIHHIVRAKTDAAWPAPIWGYQELTDLSEIEITERLDALKQQMPNGLVLTA